MHLVDWVGIWGTHSQGFLWVLIVFTSLAFALPIFLMPLTWARWLRWRLPKEPDGHDLAVYFGRCLGAFVLIVELLMMRAAISGEGLIYTFQVLIAVAVFMVIVHVQGAVQRIQPMTETLEIGMYSGLGLLVLLFYPG
ncbi:MAG: hypothetical protein HY847_01110 [Betaproteobacteria bacterium]|nr:hypothetical protein [Betaproteobacteria bacterium]